MTLFFSLLFQISTVVFGFIVIYKIFSYLLMNKLMRRISASSEAEKLRQVQFYSGIFPFYRILFWLMPLNLLLFPLSVYVYLRDSFYHASGIVVMMYIIVLEDYFYRKTILRAIGKQKTRLMLEHGVSAEEISVLNTGRKQRKNKG